MRHPPPLLFRVADPSSPEVRDLVQEHLAGMFANSPEESVHALGVAALSDPSITLWSAWAGDALAGMGALRRMNDHRAELKSMRVAARFLGQGVGRALLSHLLAEATKAGFQSVWLETGSGPAFEPALSLYARAGFERCGPFEPYAEDPFSVFMTRRL